MSPWRNNKHCSIPVAVIRQGLDASWIGPFYAARYLHHLPPSLMEIHSQANLATNW